MLANNVQRFALMWSPELGKGIKPPEPNRWAACLANNKPVGAVTHKEAGAFTKEQLALPEVTHLLQAGIISVVPWDKVGKAVIVHPTTSFPRTRLHIN